MRAGTTGFLGASLTSNGESRGSVTLRMVVARTEEMVEKRSEGLVKGTRQLHPYGGGETRLA